MQRAVHSAGSRHRRALGLAFCLTAGYLLVAVLGTALSGSLALLSEAAHLGTDTLGLGMALAAVSMAGRPARPGRAFGSFRLEALTALANSALLFGVAGYVLIEAARRWSDPPEVAGPAVLLVAAGGLAVNVVSFRMLSAGAKVSLNVRGARLEVLGDIIGASGVLLAGAVIVLTGWRHADPLFGGLVGLLILPRTWLLSTAALRVLMESAPTRVDVPEVGRRIAAVPGVAGVHDLHIWTVTSGLDSASGHVVLAPDADRSDTLREITTLLADEYGITHTTIQCEPPDFSEQPNPV